MSARAAVRRLRAEWLERSGANARARRALDGSAAAILMYHRVLPRARAEELAVEPGMYVEPETFAHHLDWLLTSFRVLPLAEILAVLSSGRTLPRGACAITFDDGWQDNFEHAFPLLAGRGLPATIFLVTDRVGTRGAFWPDDVCRRVRAVPRDERRELGERVGVAPKGVEPTDFVAALKPLSQDERDRRLDLLRASTPAPRDAGREIVDWPAVRQMAGAGIDFESHGATHAILTGLDDDGVRRELAQARTRLREERLGRADVLAYPSGAVDARVRRLAQDAGYHAAVTTVRGIARRSHDALLIPRIGLHEDVSRARAEFHRLVPGRA